MKNIRWKAGMNFIILWAIFLFWRKMNFNAYCFNVGFEWIQPSWFGNLRRFEAANFNRVKSNLADFLISCRENPWGTCGKWEAVLHVQITFHIFVYRNYQFILRVSIIIFEQLSYSFCSFWICCSMLLNDAVSLQAASKSCFCAAHVETIPPTTENKFPRTFNSLTFRSLHDDRAIKMPSATVSHGLIEWSKSILIPS